MKFKVGDRVKVICEIDKYSDDVPNYTLTGVIHEINIYEECSINVYFEELAKEESPNDNGTWDYIEDELELEKVSPTSDEILTWIREQNISIYYNDVSNRIGYGKKMICLNDMPDILESYHSWRQNQI